MKLKNIFGVVVLVSFVSQAAVWRYCDFDEAMKTALFPRAIQVTKQVVGIEGSVLLSFCKYLYEQNNPANITASVAVKIPKIIHQIWLGSPVPDVFKKYSATWQEKHPGWQYKLWTDEDVEKFPLYNRKYYDEATNYAVKSDILRWEIVYQIGGVYVDMDYECLQSLDEFHHKFDFYTALQPLDTQYVQLGAALFGATKGHPLLRHCIATIGDDWGKQGAPAKSGPIHFTHSFFACAGTNGLRDIAFPASYFYPLGCQDTVLNYAQWLHDGAYAVHHWAKSWMPRKYRTVEFRSIENDDQVQTWRD